MRSSLSLRVAIRRDLTSCGARGLFRVSTLSSRDLSHGGFHRREAHSEAAMMKSREPLADLIFRRGRAITDVMSKPCG